MEIKEKILELLDLSDFHRTTQEQLLEELNIGFIRQAQSVSALTTLNFEEAKATIESLVFKSANIHNLLSQLVAIVIKVESIAGNYSEESQLQAAVEISDLVIELDKILNEFSPSNQRNALDHAVSDLKSMSVPQDQPENQKSFNNIISLLKPLLAQLIAKIETIWGSNADNPDKWDYLGHNLKNSFDRSLKVLIKIQKIKNKILKPGISPDQE